MSDDCLFCKIASGEIGELMYENDHVVAFRDISPQAPTHILIIPKEHIPTVNDLADQHAELVGKMFLAAAELARQEGFSEDGYRLVMNCGSKGGQAVYHIHLHLLGGRQMDWPPG
mgnify:CR=1 FL=1